jgi:hypothetical protein
MGVLAVAQDEARGSRNVMYSKGLSAVLFEERGRLPSNLVHEIHHHVEHNLHGPNADLAHGNVAWAIHAGPFLLELEDAVGNALLDVLVAVPGAARWGPSR